MPKIKMILIIGDSNAEALRPCLPREDFHIESFPGATTERCMLYWMRMRTSVAL